MLTPKRARHNLLVAKVRGTRMTRSGPALYIEIESTEKPHEVNLL
jgi:hypothetical protein